MVNQEQYDAQINQWAKDAIQTTLMYRMSADGSPEEGVFSAGLDAAYAAVPNHAIALSVIQVLLNQVAMLIEEADEQDAANSL